MVDLHIGSPKLLKVLTQKGSYNAQKSTQYHTFGI